MILIISFSCLLCFIVWALFYPEPPKVKNKYSQPGKWYWMKRLVFHVILWLRKRRHGKSDDLSGIKQGYGVSETDPEIMESPQPVDHHPFAIDTTYFAAFGPDGTNLVMRVARRPDRCSEIWLFLDLPGIGQFQHPVHPDVFLSNTNGASFECAGLQFEMLEPMLRWKINYSGLMRVGLCNDINNKPEQYVSVQMSFIWENISDCFNFDTDLSAGLICDGIAKEPWTKAFLQNIQSKHQTHYEQWGELHGRIYVEGHEERTVKLKTLRDHTYGIRDWRSFHRYAIHFIWLETGLVAQVGVICQDQIFTHLKIGYISYPNADMVPITGIDLNLWDIVENGNPPENYSFTFWADNQKYEVKVRRGITPIFYHHEDRGCKILESFSTYTVNGIQGRGLTEYSYRNFDGPSYVQDVSLPQLKEPDKIGTIISIPNTIDFTDGQCSSSFVVGGKGSQLALLTTVQQQLGATVPKGFCITLAAFDRQLQAFSDLNNILENLTPEKITEEGCKNLQRFETLEMLDSIKTDIISSLKSVFKHRSDTVRVAVRSSAMGEDGSEASSAGQMETYLGIQGIEKIIEAVKKCWASAFTFQAIEYRRQHGQPMKTSVGVVIQEIVPADVAGVLFTTSPVNGDNSVMLLNANYGLGESVVNGKSDPDTVTIRKQWKNKLLIQDKVIGNKTCKILVDDSGGVKEERINDRESAVCCLDDPMILRLAEIGIKLEKYFGNGRDIEWAINDGQVYLLQCRPITCSYQDTDEDMMHEFDSGLTSDIEVLTTGNISEMMPGAVTPLTNSVFTRAINYSLQSFMYDYSGKRSINKAMVSVKSYCNHIFISLFYVESIIVSVAGTENDMVELALLGEVISFVKEENLRQYYGQAAVGTFRRFWNFLKMMWTARQSGIKTKEYEEFLPKFIINLDQDPDSLYKDITNHLPLYYQVFATTITNSSRSSSWANVVMSILTKNSKVWTQEHYGDLSLLLTQCIDVYSAEVPNAMQNLAKDIADSGCREEFLQCSEQECFQLIQNNAEIKSSLDKFFKRHGHRCVREAEFQEKSWQSEPTKLMNVLKAILKSKLYEKHVKPTKTADELVQELKTELSSISKWIIKKLIPIIGKAVGDRELGKSISIQYSEVFKKAYWKLAEVLYEECRIPDRDLIFYFTHYEIGVLLKTRSAKLILRANRRRKVHEKQMALRFVKTVSGTPQIVKFEDSQLEVEANFTWSGMPVSQGIGEGPARVVTSLQDAGQIQSGDILVVTCTDVGWSPYFPLIKGLVTEVGGLVSHGAVVAREYGIPCIVNVPNATLQITSGDKLIINGTAGTVTRVNG